MPTRMEFIQAYAEGWTEGDAQKILDACTPSYFLDDPRHEHHPVRRNQFEDYLKALVKEVSEETSGPQTTFMEITDVIVSTDQSLVSAWWTIPGLNLQGAGLIKVSDRGVESEKIAYYGD